MALVRLQKFLSECGVCSRRAAEELMLAGKVRVNGQVIKELGTKVEPGRDRVQVRNKFVNVAPKGVALFNKPKGVVSTLSDPEGRPSVADYLTKHYQSYYPVGRLDWESTGLMILTNDGDLADRLLHPRYGHTRTYHVRVEGKVSDLTLRKIERGVTLEDGVARATPVVLEGGEEDSTWLQLTVTEGRNRLIRRIMLRVGHPVMKLKRITHGPFKLAGIRPGGIKKLTEREYKFFRAKVFGEDPKPNQKEGRSGRNGLREDRNSSKHHNKPRKPFEPETQDSYDDGEMEGEQ